MPVIFGAGAATGARRALAVGFFFPPMARFLTAGCFFFWARRVRAGFAAVTAPVSTDAAHRPDGLEAAPAAAANDAADSQPITNVEIHSLPMLTPVPPVQRCGAYAF